MIGLVVSHAPLTAIGAFESAVVGWFDFEKRIYRKIEIAQQCEVLSAIGDVAVGDDGKASLHVHVVLGLSDGTTRGGHLLEGAVRPRSCSALRRSAAMTAVACCSSASAPASELR